MSQKTVRICISHPHAALILIVTGLFVGFALEALFDLGRWQGYIGLGAAFVLFLVIWAAFERSQYRLPVSSYVVSAVVGSLIQRVLV